MHPVRPFLLACALAPLAASAQVTIKPDGQWRSLLTAGASVASGNSSSTSINLGADVVRARSYDKWALTGRALYSSNDGVESQNRLAGSAMYQRDFAEKAFGFGQLDLLRDEPSNLSSRTSVGAGVGYHLVRSENHSFDISTGLGYTLDRYVNPEPLNGSDRTRYNRAELILAEESTHKLTETTSFKQKLTVLPNLRDRNDYRAVFDAGISVSMTPRIALTATLSHRYDNTPAPGLKSGDTLFITGVSYRFD
jgi:putative salt-induced outer membrane protein YdiY